MKRVVGMPVMFYLWATSFSVSSSTVKERLRLCINSSALEELPPMLIASPTRTPIMVKTKEKPSTKLTGMKKYWDAADGCFRVKNLRPAQTGKVYRY